MTPPDKRARFRGCLLGGAVGDALGAPVEFLSRDAILDRFGPDGISMYASASGRLGCCRFRFRLANAQASDRRNCRISGRDGGRVFPVFVANPRTERLYKSSDCGACPR